jgi:hypothetical protein
MLVDDFLVGANYVNAHSADIDAGVAAVWAALRDLPMALARPRWVALPLALPLLLAAAVRGDFSPASLRLGSARLDLRKGERIGGGFKVIDVVEEKEVLLQGRHRYADYVTNVYLEPRGRQRTRVRNVTRATFKTAGLGGVYLAGVHVFHDIYIDWMLHRLKQLAEETYRVAPVLQKEKT